MLMWVVLGVGGSHASPLVSLLAGRTVSVNPVPYAPGPSSPCVVGGQLGFVSVDHDEDGVFFPPVPDVVFVARVFDVGVHDAGVVVSALVGVFEVIPAVCAAAASFVGFHGEGGSVVEGEGGGECVAVIVHVGEGDVCDVTSA